MNEEPKDNNQKRLEDAFVMAESHYFEPAATPDNPDGHLEAFSSRRKRVAGSLGMKMFYTMTSEEEDQMINNMVYPGIYQDCAILLWVCLQTPKKLNWALRYPDRAMDELNDWADDMQMSVGEVNQTAAISCFYNLVFEVIDSSPGVERDSVEGESKAGKPTATMQDLNSSSHDQQGTPSIKLDGNFPLPEQSNI